MKKFLSIFIFLALLSPGLALAKDSQDSEAGALPGTFSYIFDRGAEKISILFTFDKEKKVAKLISFERERKAEIATMNSINTEVKPVSKPVESKPTDTNTIKPVTTKPVTTRPTQVKPVTKPVETKPVTTTGTISVKPITPTPVAATSTDPTIGAKEDSDMQIMYWWGKVNRHLEDGEWVSDPDGISGADINMLTHCKKWYPNSVAVKENVMVTTDGWRDRGNVSEYTSTKMSYYCMQKK